MHQNHATDEGETWEKLNSGVKSTLFCLTVSDANILIGGNELILKSSDNGNTWLRKDTIYSDIYAILKISEDIGIAVGGFFSTNAFIEAIYITNNNGYTWVKQKLNFRTGLIRSVLKLNDNSLIIASSDCIDLGQLCDVGIYKSTGNYSNYKQIYNLKGYGFHSLVSPDGTSIIAVGYEGRIIYSSDAGENWIDRKSSYNNPLRSVAYYSKDNYYAVGDSGIIISTSDNGQNYTKLNSNTSNKLRSICFPSQYYGIAVGANGTIIKMLFE